MQGTHGPWFGGIRLRYFGPRALTEDNSVRSHSSIITNLKLGYRLSRGVKIHLEVLNLFNRQVIDIDYYYTSLLKSEVGAAVSSGTAAADYQGISDIHSYPAEPRQSASV
ncbi:MAG: TonB-dependent receptor [Candidatus Protistobacter heckmanni]|nr:TonB-dependent receptor [Candidatus Protistobacter heckmanni]